MTGAWYAQKANYDFAKGKAKGKIGTKAAGYDDVAGLTAMLWKGKTGDTPPTDFAAFAVKGGCAAARFCVEPNKKTAGDAAATEKEYKTNVLKQCVDKDGVDFCFTEAQFKEHNK